MASCDGAILLPVAGHHPLAFDIPIASRSVFIHPEAQRSRITKNKVTGQVNHGDGDGERIEHQSEERLALPQPFFGSLSIRHILKATQGIAPIPSAFHF